MTEDLKRAYRNAWILVLAATAFIVGFFVFVLYFSFNAPKPDWDMGGVKFVPASSEYGEGYFSPVTPPPKKDVL